MFQVLMNRSNHLGPLDSINVSMSLNREYDHCLVHHALIMTPPEFPIFKNIKHKQTISMQVTL